MRFAWMIGGVVVTLASSASADEPAPRWWERGPAGGAYGLFVQGGATAGQLGYEPFAAAAIGLGVSVRWIEASANGYFGSSFDANYNGGAFLAHFALRVPVTYVAFTLGPSLGYLEVPGHSVSGFTLEPLVVGVEIDPVCHLRIGVRGAWAQIFSEYAPEGALRGEITIGYVMGRCVR